jgi:hypothetical protein
MPVVAKAAAGAEHQHGTVFAWSKPRFIRQPFRQEKAQLAGCIHLEELGIIPHLSPV